MVDGFHVPVMPLFDVVGNAGGVAFWHREPICVKVGVTFALTTMLIVAVVAHCPAVGVNV